MTNIRIAGVTTGGEICDGEARGRYLLGEELLI